MNCPTCGSVTTVKDSRAANVTETKWRRRRMCDRGHRFSTVEMPLPPGVRATDAATYSFDFSGIRLSRAARAIRIALGIIERTDP